MTDQSEVAEPTVWVPASALAKLVSAGEHVGVPTVIYRVERDSLTPLYAAPVDTAALVDRVKTLEEAIRDARAVFSVEYAADGTVQSVGYDSNALRPLVAALDRSLGGSND